LPPPNRGDEGGYVFESSRLLPAGLLKKNYKQILMVQEEVIRCWRRSKILYH